MIQNQWYAVLPAKAVKIESVLGVKRLGMELAFFRTRDGQVGCVADQCSHRGAAISKGQVKGNCVQCPFHGLEFSAEGECKLAPSLGKETKESLTRFNVKHYAVREAHGIIYLWYGSQKPTQDLPFFEDELNDKMAYSEMKDQWNAFYSRCIENQLDVLHLPFVHYNTIGKGNKTVVNGPKVTFEMGTLCTSAQNEVDTGQAPKKAEECQIGKTYLKFHFPNLWLNHISSSMKVMIYFVPVDDENTILYIRFYSAVAKTQAVNNVVAFLGKFGNKVIERQDKRVVVTQLPKKSEYHSKENLFPGDGPIIQYRKLRQELKDLAAGQISAQKTPLKNV